MADVPQPTVMPVTLASITVYPPRFLAEKTEKDLSFVVDGKYIMIILFRDSEDPSNFTLQGYHFPTANRFGSTTNKPQTFQKAKEWLEECIGSHHCSTDDLGGFPGRLLDIREKDRIRVIATTGSEHPYACLSYRWGGTLLLTNARTIDEHRSGIAFDHLSKTFKDAVIVARSMKVDYLWIDALCILQEIRDRPTEQETQQQKEDYARENSKMSAIYRKSHFTISADISTSTDKGIFSEEIEDHKLSVIADDGKAASFYIRADKNHWGGPSELEKRGWTFQEFLLPPRVLHFGEFDVIWRCKQAHKCECGQITGAAGWRKWLGELAKTVPADDFDALEHWEDIVSNYSVRSLGYPEDKLPALSGLAQVFQRDRRQHGKDATYLAGLWREFLVQGLCWYSTTDYSFPLRVALGSRALPNARTRPEEAKAGAQLYRAPSWSWAAVELDGPDPASRVPRTAQHRFWARGKHALHPIHPWGQQRQVCVVEDAACEMVGENPTGAVKAGYIKLSGWPVRAWIADGEKLELPWTLKDVSDGTAVKFCMPDCRADPKVGDGLQVGTEVLCMPILEALSARRSERGCLILRPDGEGSFKRVGFCILVKERAQQPPQEPREANWWQTDFTRPEKSSVVRDFALSLDGVVTSVTIV
ncbi:hypothetical protein SLS56_010894 [Neofusicoccum ribis]|uniref:Heterokaryon incompatibility domain-containing protein n=1 Tax=Neofusicoccum ribis TaxID=45134 RepID=A0ABR3SD43_9PEZI